MTNTDEDAVPILFQNNDIIAVNKPIGISVHNNEEQNNLILLLKRKFPKLNLFPVHRLDKETSGVQVFALNSEAAQVYANDFQSRNVKKVYRGVLRGQLKLVEGVWTQSLTDKAEGHKNPQGIGKDRVACETRFKVLQQTKYFTLCEFHLITGRQHQIRKHTALTNHALVGDSRYGDAKYNARMAQLYGTDRMFLHCCSLEIKSQELQATVPDIFYQLLK